MLNISRVPSVFKSSPADSQISIYDGQQWRPGENPDTQYTAMEVCVDAAGNGDFLTIPEAFTFLGASPGVVHVKAGTYTITASITLATQQELRGSGYGTLITTTMNGALVTSSANNVGVYNLRLDGNSVGAAQTGIVCSGDQCIIRDCWIIDMGADGISVGGTSGRINIDSCVIENCSNRGILLNASDLGIISNCEITQCDNQGIRITNTALYNVIIGNNIHNNGSGGVDDAGILMDGLVFQNIINSNSIRDHAGANETGLLIKTSASPPSENIVMGNISQNNTTNFTDGGTSTQIGHNISS